MQELSQKQFAKHALDSGHVPTQVAKPCEELTDLDPCLKHSWSPDAVTRGETEVRLCQEAVVEDARCDVDLEREDHVEARLFCMGPQGMQKNKGSSGHSDYPCCVWSVILHDGSGVVVAKETCITPCSYQRDLRSSDQVNSFVGMFPSGVAEPWLSTHVEFNTSSG